MTSSWNVNHAATAEDIIHEHDHMDEVTTGLHIQAFLDQWNYSVLHSGIILESDRPLCVLKALDLFEMHGLCFEDGEKEYMAEMEEDTMIQALAHKMPNNLRKTLDHYTLQLQLVISTVTRQRRALEDEDHEQVRRVNEDADAGVGQQIIVQAIVEAGKDIGHIVGVMGSWKNCAEGQVKRMLHCAEEAENAQKQLTALSAQMGAFGGDQKAKSKSVLTSMIAANDQGLVQTVFSAWMGDFVKYKAEKDIHDMFKRQIEDAELKLIEFKAGNKKNAKGVLLKQSLRKDAQVLQEHFLIWSKKAANDKENRELEGKMAEAQERLKTFKESQTANSKKVITRMTAGKDSTLVSMCWQAWVQFVQEYKKNKDFEDAVKASEQQLQSYMAKKSAEAKSMFSKIMGSTDSGLVCSAFQAWRDDFLRDKEEAAHLESISAANLKFSDLSTRQKKAAKNICYRTNNFDEENWAAQCFHGWLTHSKINRTMGHYSGKLNAKKQQLDAVNHMFKSFATQLEKGISSTPRSQQTINRGANAQSTPELASRPPQMPS